MMFNLVLDVIFTFLVHVTKKIPYTTSKKATSEYTSDKNAVRYVGYAVARTIKKLTLSSEEQTHLYLF